MSVAASRGRCFAGADGSLVAERRLLAGRALLALALLTEQWHTYSEHQPRHPPIGELLLHPDAAMALGAAARRQAAWQFCLPAAAGRYAAIYRAAASAISQR